MTLLTFHYITTSFFLGIWFGYPRNILLVVAIHYIFQAILYGAGLVIPDKLVFWLYQGLASLEGVVLASLFLIVYQSKHTFLEIKHRYERVWLTWFFSLAAYLGVQLFFANINHPYGILFTILGTLVVLIGMGYSLLFDNIVFESAYEGWGNKHLIRFVGLWTLLTISMQSIFWADGLKEYHIAFISGAGPLFWIIVLFLLYGVRKQTLANGTEQIARV